MPAFIPFVVVALNVTGRKRFVRRNMEDANVLNSAHTLLYNLRACIFASYIVTWSNTEERYTYPSSALPDWTFLALIIRIGTFLK